MLQSYIKHFYLLISMPTDIQFKEFNYRGTRIGEMAQKINNLLSNMSTQDRILEPSKNHDIVPAW